MIKLWDDEKQQPEWFVRFGKHPTIEGVVAYICDERGKPINRGCLMRIDGGDLRLCNSVDPDAAAAAGVPLDGKGRWRLAEHD